MKAMELTKQYVMERMGSATSNKEADAMLKFLAGKGVTTQETVNGIDDVSWFAMIPLALQAMAPKTLKELIIEKKCRKGEAHGTTKRGAYWCPYVRTQYFVVTAGRGGDGIGQSAADITVGLDLRHYRDGTVSAVLVRERYHQNEGTTKQITNADCVLSTTTVEDVVVALKGVSLIDDGGAAISNYCVYGVVKECVAFGMPEAAPSPDDIE